MSCSYKQGQALRVSWKIILARRACGIFPANLACTGHDLLWPVVTGTPAPKSRITKINCYVTAGNKEKYSIETLRERNVSYDHQHWLTQEDVDMANSYVELIERTRSKITPQIGDRLVYVTEHGDYYGNALIDSRSAKKDIFPYANSRMCLSCGKRTAISV